MNRITFFITSLLLSTYCYAQDGEFKTYSSGLMYSDVTMKQLEFIVDSLHLKFSTCDLNKTYFSKFQAKGHYVDLDTGDIKAAQKDMANNLPFEDFIKKYPNSMFDKDLVILKFKNRTYRDKEIVNFESLIDGYGIDVVERPEIYSQLVKGTWISEYWEGGNYSKESISGFYFSTDFEKQALPEVYARMVQYSNCMVDTTTQIFKENAARGIANTDTENTSKLDKFMSYIDKETNKPSFDKNNYRDYRKKLEKWNSLKTPLLDSNISKREEFSVLLKEAVTEAIDKGGSYDDFEEYVGRYYSKKAELDLKRGRKVYGQCSMDDSPRIHAKNIAILSAETINWEIFLRAHLDIMNDRFDRVSDGSYAWAERQTYIMELEELEINVTDLLLGISLRIENPSQNHYYGNIGRIGRALSESKYADEIGTKILEMIRDNELDDYNRIIMYYLFDNYNYHIKDQSKKKQNTNKLKNAIQELPDYLAKRIEIDE